MSKKYFHTYARSTINSHIGFIHYIYIHYIFHIHVYIYNCKIHSPYTYMHTSMYYIVGRSTISFCDLRSNLKTVKMITVVRQCSIQASCGYIFWVLSFIARITRLQQKLAPIHYTQRNLCEILLNQTETRLVTIFQLIWNQTDVRLVPNQSENEKYNLTSVWFNKISKRFLCVYRVSANGVSI